MALSLPALQGILRWPQRQLLGLKNLFLATADDPSLSEELREVGAGRRGWRVWAQSRGVGGSEPAGPESGVS